MPKVVYYLLLSLFLLILMFDTYVFFSSVGNFRDALDQALDAAIVAGIDDEDSRHGQLSLNYHMAYHAAEKTLKKNLKLDENMRNLFYDKSSFTLLVKQREGEGGVRQQQNGYILEGQFTAWIELLCLKVLGIGSLPYSVRKTQDFLNTYV